MTILGSALRDIAVHPMFRVKDPLRVFERR
jgi:hypothetical protein